MKGINVFLNQHVADEYDKFYLTDSGKKIDEIEKKIVSSHLKGVDKGDMLELGCGTGHWTDFFTKKGFKVLAIDESEAMIRIANSKNIENASFLKADACSLPFSDNSFSVIAAITMFEFVGDIAVVLNEIDRVLKPGGSLIVGCLNRNSELGKNKESNSVYKNAYFFSPEEIKSLLTGIGTPFINYGVYFSAEFAILDGTAKQNSVQPSFFAASVKKNNFNKSLFFTDFNE